MIYASTKYDFSGRKRKQKKTKGPVYSKYTPPKFETYVPARSWRDETPQYKSVTSWGNDSTTKAEHTEYTGTYIKGIATMHKSNAVPVTNSKHATEISQMAK